jgi:hypothetical protein
MAILHVASSIPFPFRIAFVRWQKLAHTFECGKFRRGNTAGFVRDIQALVSAMTWRFNSSRPHWRLYGSNELFGSYSCCLSYLKMPVSDAAKFAFKRVLRPGSTSEAGFS